MFSYYAVANLFIKENQAGKTIHHSTCIDMNRMSWIE